MSLTPKTSTMISVALPVDLCQVVPSCCLKIQGDQNHAIFIYRSAFQAAAE